ncbi:hypothetical protein Agub_g3695 [Astrephomene gubernaculifera]|uniref:Uncharacterized protein n=1 Tax=Astrephomene gubernaculifera TaxID=47775 RepID=A0AAD3DJ58_9CHLO|nr:hypothetical protein Agub_g3695 [Astrephomene gubernaculifera]
MSPTCGIPAASTGGLADGNLALYAVNHLRRNFNWTVTVPLSQKKFNWSEHQEASFHGIKHLYDEGAAVEKLSWFNEFSTERVMAAARSYYAVLYGYYGKNFVSGFKDSRYVCGHSFQSGRCQEVFLGFMTFLRNICLDVKMIFNSRASASFGANSKLYDREPRNTQEAFVRDLNETHALYDAYVRSNPDHALRVFYEDMYDAEKNATLVRQLLQFLGEDNKLPANPIRFNRMPPSSTV